MRKLAFALSLFGLQFASAQENTDKIFNFGPMARIYGILSFHSGDNYLADSNESKVSAGVNLSPFEVYGFRPYIGVDHVFYDTDNAAMAADVIRTKNTAIYGLLSYTVDVAENFSVEPYIGGGSSTLTFKRADNNDIFDTHDVDRQHGAEFRAGLYLDYKVASIVSVFAGVNYVRGSYSINTVPEYEDYFGKAQSVQINLGLKFGHTMKDKRKQRDTQAQTPQ